MDAANERARLIRALTESFDEGQATLSTVDPARVVYADSGWTVKDLAAHFSAWEAEMLRSLQAYVDGSEYAVENFENDDAQNAIFYERRKHLPLETIVQEWTQTRESLKALISSLSDAQLEGEMLFPWHERGKPSKMIGSTVGHQNEHLAHIQRAMADGQPDRRAALVEQLDASLQDALGALEGLNVEKGGMYGDPKWTSSYQVAEIAAWEAEMYRSLEAFHQGGEYTIPDFNSVKFNDAIYQARIDWSYAQSEGALKSVRQQVKSITLAMTDRLFDTPFAYPSGERGSIDRLLNRILLWQNISIFHIVLSQFGKPQSPREHLVRDLRRTLFAPLKRLDFLILKQESVVYDHDGWRVKDVFGHLYTWDNAVGNALRAYRAGSEHPIPNFPGLNAFNTQQFEILRNKPLQELVDLWENARTNIVLQVWQMTPEQLAGEMTYASGRRGSAKALIEEVIEHSREHAADIARAFNPPPGVPFIEEDPW